MSAVLKKAVKLNHSLTHWVLISSDNNLSPVNCQTIIWTKDALLLFGPCGNVFFPENFEFFMTLHPMGFLNCRKVSNISRTLVGNKIVDHSDVVGASPVGAAPTTSSFST